MNFSGAEVARVLGVTTLPVIGNKVYNMKYTVILEKGDTSYGAFVPDLPGCIAAGESKEETLDLIREAIEFHLEGLREDGEAIPEPRCDVAQVEVKAA